MRAHPTLFIHGQDDRLVPLDAAKNAAKRIPCARVEVMNAGHWPMRECPGAFNAIVLRFLAQTAS
ncbi:MAG: alpha/beta fold hydrolase [Maricaulaceae bacterium]